MHAICTFHLLSRSKSKSTTEMASSPVSGVASNQLAPNKQQKLREKLPPLKTALPEKVRKIKKLHDLPVIWCEQKLPVKIEATKPVVQAPRTVKCYNFSPKTPKPWPTAVQEGENVGGNRQQPQLAAEAARPEIGQQSKLLQADHNLDGPTVDTWQSSSASDGICWEV